MHFIECTFWQNTFSGRMDQLGLSIYASSIISASSVIGLTAIDVFQFPGEQK